MPGNEREPAADHSTSGSRGVALDRNRKRNNRSPRRLPAIGITPLSPTWPRQRAGRWRCYGLRSALSGVVKGRPLTSCSGRRAATSGLRCTLCGRRTGAVFVDHSIGGWGDGPETLLSVIKWRFPTIAVTSVTCRVAGHLAAGAVNGGPTVGGSAVVRPLPCLPIVRRFFNRGEVLWFIAERRKFDLHDFRDRC